MTFVRGPKTYLELTIWHYMTTLLNFSLIISGQENNTFLATKGIIETHVAENSIRIFLIG